MANSPPTTGSNSDHLTPAARVSTERNMPTRVAAEGSRRNAIEYRSDSPTSRHDGARPGDGDATHGSGGRSRGARNDEYGRGAQSDDDGDNDNLKGDPESSPRRALSSDEFALISVPLDTWVGRYVRITTPRHNGTTGLVHRTGNGWVNLQTSLGDVAKRAYDLVVIPKEKANIGSNTSLERGEALRGKRYNRGAKGGPASMGSNSGSGDERKPTSRSRNSRSNVNTGNNSSSEGDEGDSSGQDDNDDGDGDEHDNRGRPTRHRNRAAAADDGSDFDEAEHEEHDEDDGENDERYNRIRNTARSGRPFTAAKPRSMNRSGGRDRYGGGEHVKSSGRMSITYTRREGGGGKGRSRANEYDKIKDRERARERADYPSKGAIGKDRDGMKGDGFTSASRNRERDSEVGGSRSKRREVGNYFASGVDSDDRLASGSTRDRVDRSKDKNGSQASGKKDEAMIKSSWAAQMLKAKDRPNLVHWRDELVAITKDSSEDFEDATLSVELMKMRCDVCYHEKADGDKFCWNADCWMSPVFNGYFKAERDNNRNGMNNPSPHRAGYINTFGRETIIDSSLTSALQAPVWWIETKRKRKLEAHEVLSEDPALYRWQCWASGVHDPNSRDPTFINEAQFEAEGCNEKATTLAPGPARNTSGTRLPHEGNRFRGYEDLTDSERGTKERIGKGPTLESGLEALEVAHSRSGLRGNASGMFSGASTSHRTSRSAEDDLRGHRFGLIDSRPMDPEGSEAGGNRQSVSLRRDVGGGRPWS